MDKEEQKAVLKEALREWMDEKFASLGKWTLGTLASLTLAAIVYFILWANGWKIG